MSKGQIRIGGASGMWGDASMAVPQLLADGKLDYIVGDYLAEITMSIMARARAADDKMGYATDFVYTVLKPNLKEIARQGVKVIANAGGVNSQACADAVLELIAAAGLNLKVAVVLGDDLSDRREEYAAKGVAELFSGEPFPDVNTIASMNAYLGGFPIAAALERGADIVITGRCVDSAVTLGACIHAFGWGREDFDKLAQGSLAGHLLECGTQATGGNFTDWETVVESLPNAGYPIAEISSEAEVVITKPEDTGGVVNTGTIAEQMLYEIGDPQAYLLPDVACDFSQVAVTEIAENRVQILGAKGHGAPEGYKVSVTYVDGYRSGQVWTLYGRDADIKAQKFAENVFIRTRQTLKKKGLPDFTETSIEVIGAECHYGSARKVGAVREVDVKLAAKHPSPKGINVFLKDVIGMALTSPPGLTAFAGARPKPSPVVRLFSMIVPKSEVAIMVECDGNSLDCSDIPVQAYDQSAIKPYTTPDATQTDEGVSEERVDVMLESLAWGRSGDKGNKANIGIIARQAEFLPWIAAAFTEQKVADVFKHFLASDQHQPVERFYLPGSNALNFLLHDVLGGGGVASLRTDAQGKGYAQLLLGEPVSIPRTLAKQFNLNVLSS